MDALYEEVSETIGEIDDLLDPAGPVWEIFGLNIPADPNPPQGVSTLTVTAAGILGANFRQGHRIRGLPPGPSLRHPGV